MSRTELDPELQRYVRGLARHLVRGDQHLAEDLAQDAFMAALQSAPRDEGAMRAWLGGILRNSLNNRRRQVAQRPRSVAYTVGAHDRPDGTERARSRPQDRVPRPGEPPYESAFPTPHIPLGGAIVRREFPTELPSKAGFSG